MISHKIISTFLFLVMGARSDESFCSWSSHKLLLPSAWIIVYMTNKQTTFIRKVNESREQFVNFYFEHFVMRKNGGKFLEWVKQKKLREYVCNMRIQLFFQGCVYTQGGENWVYDILSWAAWLWLSNYLPYFIWSEIAVSETLTTHLKRYRKI